MYAIVFVIGAAGLALASCKNVDCGPGTIDQGGTCVPADETVSTAQCGPFTELAGTICKPTFDPTTCGEGTDPDFDPTTGVTTCVGNGGGGGCGSPFACPPPNAGKQTICGQLYDLESGDPLTTASPVGSRCTAVAASGPCAIELRPFDAITFAQNPSPNATPLASDPLFVDDCGRYRVSNITPPGGPFLALGIDDANVALRGPTGVTNFVGVATLKAADTVQKDFEAFVIAKTTTDMWASTGGPTVAAGIYTEIFRAHKTGLDNQPNVQSTKDGGPNTANDFYFGASQTKRDMIDQTAMVTGANGTALVQGAVLSDGLGQSGEGGVDSTCQYESFTGAALAGVVFVQIYRPIDGTGMTCDL